MGQEVSQNVRSRLEHCTLEDLLDEDEVIKELERHPLPTNLHKNVTRILASLSKAKTVSNFRQPSPTGGDSLSAWTSSPNTPRLLVPLQSVEFSIPKSVVDALHDFCQGKLSNDMKLSSLSNYYEFTCSIETKASLHRILRRFLTALYHDLVTGIGGTISRHSDGHPGVAYVANMICKPEYDRETVVDSVKRWAEIGRRYRGYMDALGSGCLILFPEEMSDLFWQQRVPLKGPNFDTVVGVLRNRLDLKCKAEGWNKLGDQIMQTLSKPFKFQPAQQCLGDSGIHKQFSSSTPTSFRVTKSAKRRRIATPLVFGKGGRDALANISLNVGTGTDPAPYTQGLVFPESLPSGGDGHCQVDQGRGTRESVSENLRLGEGISNIRALLNEDSTFTAATWAFQESSHDSVTSIEPSSLERTGQTAVNATPISIPPISLSVVQLEMSHVQQLFVNEPAAILGDVWFGSLPGRPPFVSLRISHAADEIVLRHGQKVSIPSPAPDDAKVVDGIYSITLEHFLEVIQRDGFGKTFWNETDGEGFLSIEVLDDKLISAFFEVCKQAGGGQPVS